MAMHPRVGLNLGLLALVIILGLIAVYEPGREKAPLEQTLLSLPQAAITHIRIERRGKESLLLKKNAGQWQLMEPFAAPADDYRIDTLLRLAQTQSLKQIPIGGKDLALFGLDTPEITLTINDQRIRFGGKTALDNRRYLLQGNTIHLVEDAAYYHLIGPASGFARKQLLPDNASIIGLELSDALHLQRHEGGWENLGSAIVASPDQVNALVDNWRFAQAISVTPLEIETHNREMLRIVVEGRDEPISLIIIQHEPELILARADLKLAYHFTAESAQNLLALKPLAKEVP